MRVVALFLIMTTFLYGDGFPKIFSSAGDEIYSNMQRYLKIKDLDIYADKPELLESFCRDANASLQRGYALDKRQEDPEASIDKTGIKSYAKELRRLAVQNEAIEYQLRRDIKKLHEEKDYKSLSVFRNADIQLSNEILKVLEAQEKKPKQEEVPSQAIVIAEKDNGIKALEPPEEIGMKHDEVLSHPSQSEVLQEAEPDSEAVLEASNSVTATVSETDAVAVELSIVKTQAKKAEESAPKEVSTTTEAKKSLTKLAYYEENIVSLKEELYALRESGDQDKMACLNDITAINYWMISLLKNENDPCATRDAIKQMKSYDKSSLNSCGGDSIRYMEWHGRIRPYVGSTLFQAEASCNQ